MNTDAREMRRAHLDSLPSFVKAVLPDKQKAAAAATMKKYGATRVPSGFQNNVVTFKFQKKRRAAAATARARDEEEEDDNENEQGGGGGGGGGGSSRFGTDKKTTAASSSSSSSSSSYDDADYDDAKAGGFWWSGKGEMSLALLLCLSLVDDAAVIAAPYFLSHLPGR